MKRLLPLLLLAAAACEQPHEREQAAFPVRTEVAKRSDFASSLAMLGTVRAAQTIPLHAPQSGVVAYPPRFANGLQTGVRVSRGETLAEVRNEQVAFARTQARLQLEAANAEFERIRRSFELGVVSSAEFSSSKVRAALARESYAQSSRDTSRLRITAPQGGTLVVTRALPPGVQVEAGAVLAEIASAGAPIIEAQVAASDRAQLRVGQPARAGELRARITEVASVVDASGTARVVAAIEAGDVPAPGSGVEVQVELDARREVLTVPEEALVAAADGPAVFVASTSEGMHNVFRVKRVPVELGGRANGRVEIVSGLRDGDRVIVSGADALTDGAVVTEAESK
jgi:multidrug efflux system membrane fusion protein